MPLTSIFACQIFAIADVLDAVKSCHPATVSSLCELDL